MSKSFAINRLVMPRTALCRLLLAVVAFALPRAAQAQVGTELWKFTTGGPVYSSPALGADGTVYFGSSDSNVYALYPNGSNRWWFATGGPVVSSPALGSDETVYVGSLDGKLYALDAYGRKQAEFATGDGIYSSPAIGVDGTVYVASKDQKVYALSPDLARTRWQFLTGGEIRSSPIVDIDGAVYVGARDKYFYAINPDGTLRWRFLAANWVDGSAAIGARGTIYFGSVEGRVYALNPDGTKQWDFATAGGVYSTPAVGLDGAVYAASYGRVLYALNSDGSKRWESALDGPVANSAVALARDGTIYVGAGDGKLYSFRADGSRQWAFATRAAITASAPAIGPDGTVYVGSDDRTLYAIRGASSLATAAWPMFRRDTRHTASGFVSRLLPSSYSPSAQMVVTVLATNTAGIGVYLVEDSPPAGWIVGEVSDAGFYDAAGRRVRFGPFFDGQPRALSYKVTPPPGESGNRFFSGSSSADGVNLLVGGDQFVALKPLHPADNRPADGWLTIGELSAYGAAWKRGAGWPDGPNPIPGSYLVRAIALWQASEAYRFDTNVAAAPGWWVNGASQNPPPAALPPGASAPNGWASAALPPSYQPGSNLTVTVTVTPATNVAAYAVEDQPPADWAVPVDQITGGGFYDSARGKIKWGPFFDPQPRVLSYQVVPTTNAGAFYGVASFDGASGLIAGQRQSNPVEGAAIGSTVQRRLPPGYSPGAPLQVALDVVPSAETGSYLVEDVPPVGWTVSAPSDNGIFDPVNRTVRFGPFFDALARTLTYTLTPPLGAAGLRLFNGTFTVDGTAAVVSGDFSLQMLPLHPADSQPIDGWLTVTELTAYSAAWKRGAAWPFDPNPIPSDHVTRAIDLWTGGERYRFDAAITNAPDWWLSAPLPATPEQPGPLPPPAGATTPSGTAVATLPLTAQTGTAFTVTLLVTPATNTLVYAVEDQPPGGWTIALAAGPGTIDPVRGKIKWGPFFDSTPRTLSYQVTPSATTSNTAIFHGVAAFDGAAAEVSGRRQVRLNGVMVPEGFVTRRLPAGYSPGARMIVTLEVLALTNATACVIEDDPPANWQVGFISHNAVFDPARGVVKFGPFFDNLPRTLTYEVTPPVTETGLEQFSGSFTVDTLQGAVEGDALLGLIPLHPADAQPIDAWLTLGEMTAYVAAWRRGAGWPAGPSPIQGPYVAQAIELWQQGEYYRFDTNAGPAPSWWVSGGTNPPAGAGPLPPPPGALSTNGLATADLPASALPGSTLPVALSIVPATNVTVYAVEDSPPAGWTAAQISDAGWFDAGRGKVKWGPFFDAAPRTLSYVVAVPAEAIGTVAFAGAAAFDGSLGVVAGEREVAVLGPVSRSDFARRELPSGYSPGEETTVVLRTAALASLDYYVVEDTPPLNWSVGAISDDGYFDPVNRKVKFGPFFDGQARALAYEVTPPLGASGTKQFSGTSLVDGVPGLVGGDHTLEFTLPHPADTQPIDHWMTITEITAYGAAWKRGAKWPFAPNPIPTPYLTRAVGLWRTGERYSLDPALEAPLGWISATNVEAGLGAPVAIPPGVTATNGLAIAVLPKFFQTGVPITVAISLTPATNVLVQAAEDQPPAAWPVTDISTGGFYDSARGKVKWGPFFDAQPRTLSYRITPTADARSTVRFLGGAAFDGKGAAFQGRRQIFLTGSQTGPALGPPVFVPGTGASITLNGIPGEVYELQMSADLLHWQVLATLTNVNSASTTLDAAAANLDSRFYRARWP